MKRIPLFGKIFAAVVVLGLIYLVAMPPSSGGKIKSKRIAIINNLRQLDGAKGAWGFEQGLTGNVEVAQHDVAPYLGRGDHAGWVPSIAQERYLLKSLEESPEAHLTKPIGDMPKGTIMRFRRNSVKIEIILPK